MHFSHNDALIVTMHSDNCRMSKILVDGGSIVNIMYGSALDIMEDTPEMARVMINSQSQVSLIWVYGNKMHSPGTIALPVHADPYNVITEFYAIDIESPHNAILGRPWIHMMKVVLSSYHQLLWYPTPTGTTDIKGDQVMSKTIVVIAKSGWVPKTTKAISDKDSPARKKQKQVATQ